MSEFIHRRITQLQAEVEHLLAVGRYRQAADKQRDICRLIDRSSTEDVPGRCRHLHTLAELKHQAGEPTEARAFYLQAQRILHRYLRQRHPELFDGTEDRDSIRHRRLQRYGMEIAQHLNLLAMLYRRTQRDHDARRLIENAMAIVRADVGINHPDFAILLNNLAGIEHSAGRFLEAESLYRQALETLGNALGEEHPEFAQSQCEMARLYRDWGRTGEAIDLAGQAWRTLRLALGKQHPTLVATCQDLAELHIKLGDFTMAEWYLLQAQKILEAQPCEAHPESAKVLHCLADVHRLMEDYEAAETLEQEALNIEQSIVDRP